MAEHAKMMGLAAAIVAPWVLGVWILADGHRERVEVEPDTLRFRHVRSYALPLIGVQVSPERTEVVDSPLRTYLVAQGWVGDDLRDTRWIAARAWSAGEPTSRGPAQALHEAFCEQAGAWVAWSRAHPHRAARLWPQVVVAARAGRPHDAGALLRSARKHHRAEIESSGGDPLDGLGPPQGLSTRVPTTRPGRNQ